MITNLKIFDVVNTFRNNANINNLFPWWIFTEKPLREQRPKVYPRCYITKVEYWYRNWITRKSHIEVSIVWNQTTVPDELDDMFMIIDKEIMPEVDWCIPIQKRNNVDVFNIDMWITRMPVRDEKWNIVMRKTYNFNYLIQS